MYCGKCGSENPDDARFCGSCGAATGAPSPEPARPPPEVVPVLDADADAGAVAPGLKWGILVVSVLVPLVGIGMGLYYWVKGGSEEKTALGRLWFFVGIALAVFYATLGGGGF